MEKLDIKTAGFGVRSDWLDLNDLCQRTGLQLSWQGPHGAVVVLNENIITDPYISTLAVLHTEDIPRQLSTNNVRVSLLHLRKTQSAPHWTGLKLQGKLALLQSADHSVSHSVLMNCSISEDILTFMIKATATVSSNYVQSVNMVPVKIQLLLSVYMKSTTGQWNSCSHLKRMLLLQRTVCVQTRSPWLIWL